MNPPQITLVIATSNSAAPLTHTLDSALRQKNVSLEVLIIDANSTDRTVETVQLYRDPRIRIFSVATFNRYEMFNFGISHGHGTYFHFLTPGDVYLSPHSDSIMMSLATNEPDLLIGGSLIRDGKKEAKVLSRPLSKKLLQAGKQPTALQAIWFHKRLFIEGSRFDPAFHLRGGLEFLCRIFKSHSPTFAETHRVVADYDLRYFTQKMVLIHFWETLRILFHYYGFATTLKWFFKQKDISRFFSLWKKSVVECFSEQT